MTSPEVLLNDFLFHYKGIYNSIIVDRALHFYKKLLFDTVSENLEIYQEYNNQIKDFEFMSIGEDSKNYNF